MEQDLQEDNTMEAKIEREVYKGLKSLKLDQIFEEQERIQMKKLAEMKKNTDATIEKRIDSVHEWIKECQKN